MNSKKKLLARSKKMDDESMVFVYTLPNGAGQIRLPIATGVNVTVDWGDGVVETHTANYPSHTYFSGKPYYTVKITGSFTSLNSYAVKDNGSAYMTEVKSLGNIAPLLTDMRFCFSYTSISVLPPNLLENCTGATSFGAYDTPYLGAFSFTKITSVPDYFFKGCVNAITFTSAFRWINTLKSVGKGLFDTCSKASEFVAVFGSCANLEAIDNELFTHNTKVITFEGCFAESPNIKGQSQRVLINGVKYPLWDIAGKGNFPATIVGVICYRGATKLTDYAVIPSGWK